MVYETDWIVHLKFWPRLDKVIFIFSKNRHMFGRNISTKYMLILCKRNYTRNYFFFGSPQEVAGRGRVGNPNMWRKNTIHFLKDEGYFMFIDYIARYMKKLLHSNR